jgi:hypothetical protein
VLSFALAPGDPLAGHIARDPTICLVADEHAAYFEIQGVIVHGRAVPTVVEPFTANVEIDRIVSFDFGRLRPEE